MYKVRILFIISWNHIFFELNFARIFHKTSFNQIFIFSSISKGGLQLVFGFKFSYILVCVLESECVQWKAIYWSRLCLRLSKHAGVFNLSSSFQWYFSAMALYTVLDQWKTKDCQSIALFWWLWSLAVLDNFF